MEPNIIFDDKKTYDDWGLKILEINISLPEPVLKKVEVPGRDGALDLSEWSGRVNYEEREVSIRLTGFGDYSDWHRQVSSIAAYLNGTKRKMWLPADPGYFYRGRFKIEPAKENGFVHEYEITGTVDPHKYESFSSAEPWIWDTFDFESGIIREYASLEVSGSRTLVIPGTGMPVVPVIITDREMEVTFEGVTYPLQTGENTIYGILIKTGKNILLFEGYGTVTVDYRGGEF